MYVFVYDLKMKGLLRNMVFGRKSKGAKPEKEKKQKKQKTPKQKGSNKQKSLIQKMGLNESVATMGLDAFSAVVNDHSAVREIDELGGYSAVALTEDALVASGITLGDEDFGAFAETLRTEQVKSLVLKNDLQRNVIILIPDEDSLDIMGEFSFLEVIDFQWAIVPFDIDDDSEAILLDSTVTLAELADIIINESELTVVDNVMIIDGDLGDADGGNHSASFEEADSDFEDEMDLEDDLDEPIADDSGYFDDEDDIDFDDDDADMGEDPAYAFGDEDDVALEDEEFYGDEDEYADDDYDYDGELADEPTGDYGYDDDTYADDSIYDEPVDELADVSQETARAQVHKVLSRTFYNDELGLEVDTSIFDLHFNNDDTQLLLFNEEPTDNSTLGVTLSQMRRDANIELRRQHTMYMQDLRSQFNVIMAQAHDKLVDVLDYKNSETVVGQKYKEIESERANLHVMEDDLVAKDRRSLEAEYERKREEKGQQAYNIAVDKYDELHKSRYEAERAALKDQVVAAIDTSSDKKLAELYDERKLVAHRLFDKSTTQALVDLQAVYKQMAAKELALYDSFRQRQDKYLRSNFSNEVLRGQAIAEQQRQRAEADDVRDQYETLLIQKQKELQTANIEANERIEDLIRKHDTTLEATVQDYVAKLKSVEHRNENLNEQIINLQQSLTTLDDRKKAEYENQLKSKDDIIKSQNEQLAFAEQRASKTAKASGGIIAAFVAVALAVGLIGGFVFGNSSNKSEPQVATPAQPQPTVVITQGGNQSEPTVSETPSDNDITEPTEPAEDNVDDGQVEDDAQPVDEKTNGSNDSDLETSTKTNTDGTTESSDK